MGLTMNSITEKGSHMLSSAEQTALVEGSVSSALVSVFRGRFCDIVLHNRSAVSYKKDRVLYDLGNSTRTFFFIQHGFVKVGTVTREGREIIYDVRKDGDVVGELAACKPTRRDRAVALEDTNAIPVPFSEIIDVLERSGMTAKLVDVFCDSLSEAYEQINVLTYRDVLDRLIAVLRGLAIKIGRTAGDVVEIPNYLTQEDISQMVAARRERVSTALNLLRRRGIVQYSNRGHLMLRVTELENFKA